MNYPPDFVARVKAAWPEWHEIHQALDQHDLIVGQMLDNCLSEPGPTLCTEWERLWREQYVKDYIW